MPTTILNIAEQLKLLPHQPGVYLMHDRHRGVIYVGKATSLKNRVRSYFQKSQHAPKIAQMVPQVAFFETIITDSEVEALVLEADLIRKYQPRYNTLLKNHRGFPYIRLSWQDKYPRLQLARKRQKDKAIYYGPYPSARAVYDLLEAISAIFPIEKCKDPRTEKRTCLYFDMKRCLGHCQAKVTSDEYKDMLQGIRLFLEGKSDTLRERLAAQMQTYASRLQFENAAQVRDTLQSLERIFKPSQRQKIADNPDTNLDTVHLARQGNLCHLQLFQVREGYLQPPLPHTFTIETDDDMAELLGRFLYQYYAQLEPAQIPREILLPFDLPDRDIFTQWLTARRGKIADLKVPQRGRKKELLEMVYKNVLAGLKKAEQEGKWRLAEEGLAELQSVLGLPQMSFRIEAFDISHFQGSETVASMVVFLNGRPAKDEYRRFKILSAEGSPDDFLSMQEVVSRRYRHVQTEGLPDPDLILIDGGKGQVSAALRACQVIGYQPRALIGLAKKDERLILPDIRDALHLPRHSAALRLLQQVRDESHRFAVNYHRTLRSKRTLVSELEAIPGIGLQRRKVLLRNFGSIDRIKQATRQELMSVGHLPEPIAQNVIDYFQEQKR